MEGFWRNHDADLVINPTIIVDAVVSEASGYDLLILGASSEWRLTQFAFGPMQDQISRRTATPTLMVRKVRRRETPVAVQAEG